MTTERPGEWFVKMSQLDESALTGLYSGDPTQYVRIVKIALRQYLEECLRQHGEFREFFNKIVTSSIGFRVNEDVNHNVDPNTHVKDANTRHLQIAAYYDNVRGLPPQIYIQDQGYEYVMNSLGAFAVGWNQHTAAGHQVAQVMDVITTPIVMSITAMSERELEDIQSILSTAFGQFCKFTINYILRPHNPPNGCYWEVRIPLQHSMGAKTHIPAAPGEPRQQIWGSDLTMQIEFENSTLLQYRSEPTVIPQNVSISLTIPDRITIGRECPVTLMNYPRPIRVYSNDPRVAVVMQRGFHWIIVPRGIGTCTILATRLTSPPDTGPEILASKSITIRAR